MKNDSQSTDNQQSEPPLLETNKPEQTVYIFNMAEDVWPFISAMSNVVEQRAEVEGCANLADRDLFSNVDEANLTIITPREIDPDFLQQIYHLVGKKKWNFLVPNKHSGQICLDIIQDRNILNQLVELANGAKKLVLTSYCVSPQFFQLITELKGYGIEVYTPEAPTEENAWCVNFFGSKSGIRQLAQKSTALEPDFIMPDGLICVQVLDASRIAAQKYIKEDGVVLKTNKGHSGAGVLIFHPGDLPSDYQNCQKAILNILKQNEYWDNFPIIVESLVNINPAVCGGLPNVEFKIQKSGRIDFLYYCGMRVLPNGIFFGVEINEDIINDRISARIIDTGFFIAEQYASHGYRGYFDVDMVAAKNGEIYVSESNVRRTGGTHVYQMADVLIGKDFFTDSYILSNNAYELKAGVRPSFKQMLELMTPILFNKKTKEGLVIASASLLTQSTFAYVVFAKNKKKAMEIENKMFNLLKSL